MIIQTDFFFPWNLEKLNFIYCIKGPCFFSLLCWKGSGTLSWSLWSKLTLKIPYTFLTYQMFSFSACFTSFRVTFHSLNKQSKNSVNKNDFYYTVCFTNRHIFSKLKGTNNFTSVIVRSIKNIRYRAFDLQCSNFLW